MTTEGKPPETPDTPDAAKLEGLAAEAEAAAAPPAPAAPPSNVTQLGAAPKRGRPPGSRTRNRTRPAPAGGTAPAGAVKPGGLKLPRELVKGVVSLPYAIAAKRLGDHWLLTDGEADSMVDAHVMLAEEYLPDVVKDHPALYTCAFLHLMTIFGKVEIHARLVSEAEKRKGARAQAPTGKDTPPGATDRSPAGADRFGQVLPA